MNIFVKVYINLKCTYRRQFASFSKGDIASGSL